MLREQLAAWLTMAFAVLLVLVALTDQPGGGAATLLLGIVAAVAVALFLGVEQASRRHARKP
jgi:hypothetical protein